MTTVRIFQPSKSAMQSGKAGLSKWVVEFEPLAPMLPDPLMGWDSSQDMSQEISLSFSSLEKAIAFVKAKGFTYTVSTPPVIEHPAKSYGVNFSRKNC